MCCCLPAVDWEHKIWGVELRAALVHGRPTAPYPPVNQDFRFVSSVSRVVFTCGWDCVGCVLWIWPQVDDGGVWRGLCEEGSRLGECERSEPLTLWHIVSSHSLQPKRDTTCFPNHYCLSCHSLGSYIKMIYSFLRAKNSTMTKINHVDSMDVVKLQTLMSMFSLAWGRSRRGFRPPSLRRSEQFIENTSHVSAWLELLLALKR